MGKVLFVATVVKTHITEFHIPYLRLFKEMGWETAVAARNDYENPADCVIPFCDVFYNIPFERNPFKSGNLKAYRELKRLINDGQFDIIHCHTPVGAALTRIAAGKSRRNGTRVFYTAHGFHFCKGAPLKNWLLFYPVERLLAHRTDVLLTINKEDYCRALKFKAGKIAYVPGVGLDVDKFANLIIDKSAKRKELGLSDDEYIILSVGELTRNKNHEVVIKALAELKNGGSLDNIHYVVCGSGGLAGELKQMVNELGLSGNVHFLGYRQDVDEIYAVADLFVFMSYREGLPVALMEAMASALPVICSGIRGNSDLIKSGFNGEIVDNNPVAVSNAILMLKRNEVKCDEYAKNAQETVRSYDVSKTVAILKDLYFNS